MAGREKKMRFPKLVPIEGGTFSMGSKPAAYSSEAPYHEVDVQSFSLGVFPVTVQEFQAFSSLSEDADITQPEEDTDYDPTGCLPAHDITWLQAVDYCDWLAQLTGRPYRLPTEAEWEYAAKACKALEYPTATGDISPELANYGHVVGSLTPLGTYPANPLGLFDMAGNVWEWCNSKKGDYSGGRCIRSYDYPYNASDGRENSNRSGASRILRGGCYTNQPVHCRSAARYREFEYRASNYHRTRGKNSFGFRVALSHRSGD